MNKKAQQLQAQITNLVKTLAEQTAAAAVSEQMTAWLKTCARFHKYSVMNLWSMTPAGGDLNQVVKLTIFLTDLADFAAVNGVMEEYFEQPYPARAAVGVAALPKGVDVEADAILAL